MPSKLIRCPLGDEGVERFGRTNVSELTELNVAHQIHVQSINFHEIYLTIRVEYVHVRRVTISVRCILF